MRRLGRHLVFPCVAVLAAALSNHGARADVPSVPTGMWTSGDVFGEIPRDSASALLADGRLVVSGGSDSDGQPIALVAIYDPSSGTWQRAGAMSTGRAGHTLTALGDGRLLIAGGRTTAGLTDSTELYDPATGASVATGALSLPRADHAAARLPDDRVLIVGGWDGTAAVAMAEVFDPALGSVAQLPVALSTARMKLSATTLLDGHVLVAGGNDGVSDLSSAEIFDPATGSFFNTGAMQVARSGHVAVLLPNNNQVLVAGGMSAGAAVASAELYADWRDGFSATPNPMSAARVGGVGAGLRGHDLALVAGGGPATGEYFGYATVKTDREDYWPGEPVTVTGSGWQPGEIVVLTISEDADTHHDFVYNAVADAAGTITNAEFAPIQNEIFQHFGKRFYVTARGAASEALNTFTDGKGTLKGTIRNSVTNAVIAGATVSCSNQGANACNNAVTTTSVADGTYELTFNFPGNNNTVNISVSAPGYTSQTQSLVFDKDNQTRIIDWALVPANPIKKDQTITFGALNGTIYTYGDADFGVTATASSGLPVTFTASGQCSVSGATVHISGAGSCTITAHQPGNSEYNAALDVPRSFTIEQALPIVTVNGGAYTYNAQTHPASASAAGVGGSSVAGTFTFSYDGGAAEPLNAGSYAVVASFTSSDANYKNATGNGTVTIEQAAPVVSVTGGTYTYDGLAHPASASTTGVNASSVQGSFTFTYNGAPSDPVNAGSYAVVASFTSSDANYKNATGNGTLTIEQATPVVSVTGGTYTYDGLAHSATASAIGVNASTVSGSFTFSYNGAASDPVNAGTYTVVASFTSGDPNYKDATGNGTLTIEQATPVVSVTGGPYTYDGLAHSASASATGVNASVVAGTFGFTYNGVATEPVNAGTYAVVASFTSGDPNYKDATGEGSILIDKAMPVVTVNGGTYTYNAQTHPASASAAGVNASVVAGTFSFTYNGVATEPVNAGTYTVVASFTSGDANYKDATGEGSILIDKAMPVVTVNGGTYIYNAQTHPASASAAGVNASVVTGTFSFTYNGVATEPVNAGTYAVVASFTSGDPNYEDATGEGSILIDKAMPVVTVNGGTYTYDGLAHSASASATGVNTSNVLGTFSFTYNGVATEPVNAGTYTVVASFTSGDTNYKDATGTGSIVINKAAQTIVVTTSAPAQALFGTSFTVAATGGGSGNTIAFGAAGSCTNAGATFTMTSGYGTCTVTFNQAGNQNYFPADPVNQSVSATPWKITGFYSPVTSSVFGSPVWNVVKGGSTVPLKFEIFAGANGPEQTSLSAVKSLSLQPVNCTGGAALDMQPDQLADTGGTSLRHDGTQFIQNWKTPKVPGSCFVVVMQAADSSTITAYFQMK